jgi:hypothetical protein
MGQPSAWLPTDDELDWEYEYDPCETEALYFTLDLTTYVQDALVPKPKSKPFNRTDEARDDDDDDDDGDGDDTSGIPTPQQDPREKLQILDLHTDNPLVKFDDAVYSCYWSTDLSTQIHISQSGVTADPRRAGVILDVIALSQTRLLAKPVTLKPRNVTATGPAESASSKPIDPEPGYESDRSNQVLGATPDPAAATTTTLPLVIPRDECKNLAAERQASFLERLSTIKLKKGETDPVPMYHVKIYREPENKEEIKQKAFAEDAEVRKQTKDERAAAKAERPRKRRKRLTAVERGLVADGSLSKGGRPARVTIGAQLGITELRPLELTAQRALRKKKQLARQSGYDDAGYDDAEDDDDEADDDEAEDDDAEEDDDAIIYEAGNGEDA